MSAPCTRSAIFHCNRSKVKEMFLPGNIWRLRVAFRAKSTRSGTLDQKSMQEEVLNGKNIQVARCDRGCTGVGRPRLVRGAWRGGAGGRQGTTVSAIDH